MRVGKIVVLLIMLWVISKPVLGDVYISDPQTRTRIWLPSEMFVGVYYPVSVNIVNSEPFDEVFIVLNCLDNIQASIQYCTLFHHKTTATTSLSGEFAVSVPKSVRPFLKDGRTFKPYLVLVRSGEIIQKREFTGELKIIDLGDKKPTSVVFNIVDGVKGGNGYVHIVGKQEYNTGYTLVEIVSPFESVLLVGVNDVKDGVITIKFNKSREAIIGVSYNGDEVVLPYTVYYVNGGEKMLIDKGNITIKYNSALSVEEMYGVSSEEMWTKDVFVNVMFRPSPVKTVLYVLTGAIAFIGFFIGIKRS